MIESLQCFIIKIYTEKYFPLFIAMTFAIVSLLTITALVREEVYTIEDQTITLRVGAATNSAAITTLNKGDRLEILSERNGWYNVLVNGQQNGYVPSWLLDKAQPIDDTELAVHIEKTTPLYQSAHTDATIIHQIPADEYLKVNFENNGWLQINYKNDQGYIKTSEVTLISQNEIPDKSHESITSNNDLLAGLTPEEANKIIYMRQNNQALYEYPDGLSPVIYHPTYNQRFEYLSTNQDTTGHDYYFVRDEEGIEGYLNSSHVAFASDYIGHETPERPASISEAVIHVDAGHGGMDPGTSSLDGTLHEKNYTLPTALYLKEALEKMGARVIMSREEDFMIGLEEITQISNDNQVDAFVSIHFDALDDPTWGGTATYYFHENDYELAETINERLKTIELENNGIVFGNFQVLRDNQRPCLLLELGYMTHEVDLAYFTKEENQRKLAQAIAEGLQDYFK